MAQQLDERTLISGQVRPDDMAEIKAAGVTLLVNNRPDGEDVGQPNSADIEAAANAAGITYRHVPIARGLGPSDIEAMREAIAATGDGRMLAFCRSGNRSVLAWAVAQREEGVSRADIEGRAAQAGFSLGAVAHLL